MTRFWRCSSRPGYRVWPESLLAENRDILGEAKGDRKLSVERFREKVLSEFGPNLEHATPANVRDFLDKLQLEVYAPSVGKRIILDEPAKTYEEIIKDFFVKVLELPRDEALITLWTLAFELSFAAIESHLSERFASLFKDLE